jgi:hypothetical protein
MSLSADYIVGFTDGEGSFCVFLRQPKQRTWNTRVECHYYVKLREDDLAVLEKIKDFFGCGRVSFQKEYRENQRDNYRYQVSNLKDLTSVIIPFFKRHPLQSKRKKDFELFCTIVELVSGKQHRTHSGLDRIRHLKEKMHA